MIMDTPSTEAESSRMIETISNSQELSPIHVQVGIQAGAVIPASIGTIRTLIQNAGTVYLLDSFNAGISEEEKKRKVEEFKAGVNEYSTKQCQSTITNDFDGEVKDPEREVTPVLVTTNFYRGESALDEVDYSVAKERGRRVNSKKAREVQIQLPDIHKHGRYIMLVGGAGSGKTTLIKRYCKNVLDKKIENMKEIEVVCLINVRDMSKDVLSPKDMLFGKFLVGQHKKDSVLYGYEWMQREENQNKVLLAFDGIDTAPWELTTDTHDLKNYDDNCSAATIMYNILYGHLFPKCKLLLTSREHGIAKFPRDIRAEKIIALKGFTRDGIMCLVKQLGGDKGESIWETLQQKSLNLMLLCSTPLFLIFTIIVYKENINPPENLSGIILTLLEHHIHLESSSVRGEEVRGVIEKLKLLSRRGLLNGKVVFSEEEFGEVGLGLEDIKDLVIRVPSQSNANIYNQRLLEKDYSYFFCHQAVQEALVGLCIAGDNFEDFQNFVKNYLHLPKFIVVRQILCGVLFNKETTSLAQHQAMIPEKEKKMEYLRGILAVELRRTKDSPLETLNLLISLRECGEEREIVNMIKDKIPKISLSGLPLTPSDIHAVASVARLCKHLSIMQLVNCHLDDYTIHVLANGLKGSSVEITVFDVSFNRNLRKDSMFNLHEICIRGQGLNYWQCGFRQHDILHFDERESQPQIVVVKNPSEEDTIKKTFGEDRLLDMACYNVDTYHVLLNDLIASERFEEGLRLSLIEYEPGPDLSILCELLSKVNNIQELAISDSELSGKQLQNIKLAVEDKEIETLNIFLNPNIQNIGWKVFGEICKACRVKNLFITACGLTEEKLKCLKFALGNHKIFKFDMSRNNNMDKYSLREIGAIVEICKVEELIMGYCNFTAANMIHLKRSMYNAKVNRIDMSGNDKIGEEGYKALGEIVYRCQVKLLDASECDPTAEEVRSFKNAVHDATIIKLNMSRNRNMGVCGLRDIGELVGKCQPQELFIRQCELEENTLAGFQAGLGDSKIRFLDFGFYFMKPRKTTAKEVDIIIGLLSNVTEQLTINDWDIDEEGRRALKKALDDLPFIGLKIMFNRGKNEFISQQE